MSKILTVLSQFERKTFIPSNIICNPQFQASAHPVGFQATISAPHVHMFLLNNMKHKLKNCSYCLDIGTGTGYLTACMGQLVKPDGKVIGIEHVPELADFAMSKMKKCKLDNVVNILNCEGRNGYTSNMNQLVQTKNIHPDTNDILFDVINIGGCVPYIKDEILKDRKSVV